MFKWLKKIRAPELKSSATESVLRQVILGGGATWTPTNYMALATEGYCKNVIAYKCINSIANSVADIPIIISINGTEIEDLDDTTDKIARRIYRPNDKQTYKTFMQSAVSHRLISGSTYIHMVKGAITGDIMQLELLRPDRVTILVDGKFIPYAYQYIINGAMYTYPIDQLTNLSDVLQIKTFNPINDLYGLSPMSAAAMSIDQHNESSAWNKSLLENYSRQSGILTLKDRNDNAPALSREQLKDLSDLVHDKMSGPNNAGKVPIINYDMQFQPLSLSPVDMDWLNGKTSAARDICLAFGYPAMLLGFPEGSTYNNVAEAKLALYEETVIPLAQMILCEMSNWLSLMTKKNIEIELDLDKVSALTPRRQVARENARLDVAGGIITINEARKEMDYEPLPGGDEILVPAGKLPLDFDITQMDQPKYQAWLESEGFTPELANKYATLAFTKAK